MESIITNLDLFVILSNQDASSFDHEILFNTLVIRLGSSLSNEDSVTVKEFCRKFTRAVQKRWLRSHRKSEVFRRDYSNWLEANIDWPNCVQTNLLIQESTSENISTEPVPEPVPSTSTMKSISTMTKRSRKPFKDLSNKQKKRRSDEHIGDDPNEVAYSAAALLKGDGREDIASVIEHMLQNPEAAANIKEMLNKPAPSTIFSPEKALGLLLSLKLSKWQYITLRETTIREGSKEIYPSYYKLQKAKLQCYPPKTFVTVTDSSAKIALQALLDLTVDRILETIRSPDAIQDKQLILISKWGFDGASNQSRYKQNIESGQDDSSIFMTSLVPLKLTADGDTVWANPKPCSPRYCRPVQFSFVKETKEVVINEKTAMDNEIEALVPSKCQGHEISHQLMMTMIDGKICTYLSEAKSNAACYLCLAKPTEMNNLDVIASKTISSGVYEFGLSSLHARINVMECLLHIAYRLDFKKWSARGECHRELLHLRKKLIQDRFKDDLNLLIDIVKQGSGTTNDGNTARRFFEFPDKTAAITGLDEDLIRRFAVILQAITSGEFVDVPKFKEYARKTAEKYVELYDWYYMSSTVHKLLIHGGDIIAENAIVPIGSLSEEASEARNKDFRRFREHHSRKKSRQASNEDILNMLIVSSDPLISSTRPKLNVHKRQTYFKETLELLNLQDQEAPTEFIEVMSIVEPDSEVDSDGDEV